MKIKKFWWRFIWNWCCISPIVIQLFQSKNHNKTGKYERPQCFKKTIRRNIDNFNIWWTIWNRIHCKSLFLTCSYQIIHSEQWYRHYWAHISYAIYFYTRTISQYDDAIVWIISQTGFFFTFNPFFKKKNNNNHTNVHSLFWNEIRLLMCISDVFIVFVLFLFYGILCNSARVWSVNLNKSRFIWFVVF